MIKLSTRAMMYCLSMAAPVFSEMVVNIRAMHLKACALSLVREERLGTSPHQAPDP
jgi:hypothetical protein